MLCRRLNELNENKAHRIKMSQIVAPDVNIYQIASKIACEFAPGIRVVYLRLAGRLAGSVAALGAAAAAVAAAAGSGAAAVFFPSCANVDARRARSQRAQARKGRCGNISLARWLAGWIFRISQFNKTDSLAS